MQFDRRAESSDPDKLVATFVNVGALATLISVRDHQIIFGRRGTGKTHALQYLKDDRAKAKDIPIYIDLRTVGSSAGILPILIPLVLIGGGIAVFRSGDEDKT